MFATVYLSVKSIIKRKLFYQIRISSALNKSFDLKIVQTMDEGRLESCRKGTESLQHKRCEHFIGI